MRKSVLLLGVLALPVAIVAQAPSPARLHIYMTGRFFMGGSTRVCVDDVCDIKLGHNHAITVLIAPGTHEISAKLANLAAARVVHAEAGEEYFSVLEYTHGSAWTAGFNHQPNHGLALGMEMSNAAPVGAEKMTNDTPSPDVSARLLSAHAPDLASSAPPPSVRDLTVQEIEDAVAMGTHVSSPKMIGLYLDDVQMGIVSHIVQNTGQSGFGVVIYTAPQWVAYQAAIAHREMRPFTVADVTPEMKRGYLRVLATPNVPDRLNGANMSFASDVHRIVISDQEHGVIQPVDAEPNSVTLNSALRSATYSGLWSAFPSPDTTKTFQVIVIGDGDVKRVFTVKDKHLPRLKN